LFFNPKEQNMKYFASLTLLFTTAMMGSAASDNEPGKRIRESSGVLREILGAKDKGIPEDLLEKAQCVGVVPNLKRAGFIVGAKYGKGVVVCREPNERGWSAPSTVRIEGGSIGFQIGAGETDVVFIVMNKRGMDKLMEDKFTIGADVSAMAGPVGRSAEARTDAMLHAEILSYSRSRGVFAGVSLEGATLRPDNEDNHKLYGGETTQREILTGKASPPPAAEDLYAVLNSYAPNKKGASASR
jgi:SH3 domain-containing YSC84-like protein 1